MPNQKFHKVADHLAQEESNTEMKKIIIVILLLFTVASAYSQVATWQRRATESGPVFYIIFTDVDSLSTEADASNFIDISAIQGQTIYLSDSLYSGATTTGDTCFIIFQGRYEFGNSKSAQLNIDTITVVSNVVAQNALSLSGYGPDVRVLIKNKNATARNNKQLYLNLFANTTNYLRDRKSYGNLP